MKRAEILLVSVFSIAVFSLLAFGYSAIAQTNFFNNIIPPITVLPPSTSFMWDVVSANKCTGDNGVIGGPQLATPSQLVQYIVYVGHTLGGSDIAATYTANSCCVSGTTDGFNNYVTVNIPQDRRVVYFRVWYRTRTSPTVTTWSAWSYKDFYPYIAGPASFTPAQPTGGGTILP